MRFWGEELPIIHWRNVTESFYSSDEIQTSTTTMELIQKEEQCQSSSEFPSTGGHHPRDHWATLPTIKWNEQNYRRQNPLYAHGSAPVFKVLSSCCWVYSLCLQQSTAFSPPRNAPQTRCMKTNLTSPRSTPLPAYALLDTPKTAGQTRRKLKQRTVCGDRFRRVRDIGYQVQCCLQSWNREGFRWTISWEKGSTSCWYRKKWRRRRTELHGLWRRKQVFRSSCQELGPYASQADPEEQVEPNSFDEASRSEPWMASVREDLASWDNNDTNEHLSLQESTRSHRKSTRGRDRLQRDIRSCWRQDHSASHTHPHPGDWFSLFQFDVDTAYLYGFLQEVINMEQPHAFEDGTDRVCLLERCL